MKFIHFNRTALHYCVIEDNDALLDLLLEKKELNLNKTTNDGHTALSFALFKKPFSKLSAEKILAKNANSNPIYENTNDTLLHCLAREKQEEASLFLVENCNDKNLFITNNEGLSCLHEACKNGLEQLTRILLEKDLSTTLFTKITGEAPIHLAVINLYHNVVVALLSAKDAQLQLNLKDQHNGETPLSLAIKVSLKKARDIILTLIKAGADINQRNEKGLTLLHQAILKEDSATAIFLLENGADINAR